jgi:hypothetical protein
MVFPEFNEPAVIAHPTDAGEPAEVRIAPEGAEKTPAVAVMVVESVAQLLGVNVVDALPFEPVKTVVGETDAVYPACGYKTLVMVKVKGTPDCPVPSFATMVSAAPPAVYGAAPVTVMVGAAME